MISLIKVISEIKLINRVTPEMVNALWFGNDWADAVADEWLDEYDVERAELAEKYGYDYEAYYEDYLSFFKTLNQEKLENLYQEMYQLKQKHIKTLNEIKFVNRVTPEMAYKLYTNLEDLWDNSDEMEQYTNDYVALYNKWGFVEGKERRIIYNLNQEQLNSIYQDLLALKQKVKS